MNKIKRIFLITVDCLRADHVGCIGGGNLTPNIDEFGKKSTVFTKAFANGPGTNQSFPAILTSTYFLMHGGMRLLPRYTTLAEVLCNHGFKTVAFHSNPFLSRYLGWHRGFDEFYDFMDKLKSPSGAITRSSLLGKVIKFLDKKTGITSNKSLLRKLYYWWMSFEIPYIEGSELNKEVIDWINKNKEKPFFLWMHFMDPHRPYMPPKTYLTDFSTRKQAFMFDTSVDTKISRVTLTIEDLGKLKRLYEGEVKYVDKCLGDFFDYLESQKMLESSLIVINADHGEAFMEHNKISHSYDIVYNEVIHVPLIIYNLSENNTVSNNYVQLLDISPTILDKMEIKKPNTFSGDSLMPILEINKMTPLFSESAKPDLINLRYDTSKKVISCIYNNFKLIINDFSGTKELYNLNKDFNEKNNIITTEKTVYEELSSLIQKHNKKINLDHV